MAGHDKYMHAKILLLISDASYDDLAFHTISAPLRLLMPCFDRADALLGQAITSLGLMLRTEPDKRREKGIY